MSATCRWSVDESEAGFSSRARARAHALHPAAASAWTPDDHAAEWDGQTQLHAPGAGVPPKDHDISWLSHIGEKVFC